MIINVYIDETAVKRMERATAATGRSREDLASSAVEEALLAWCHENGFPEKENHPLHSGVTTDQTAKHPIHDRIDPPVDEPGER